MVDEALSSKDDQFNNNDQKPGKRGSSLPADQDFEEKGLSNTPRVRSYMAATESAKAKFRGQNSPRFSQGGSETNGSSRRYSLPSSTSENLSLSPQVPKLVEASERGGIRSDKSLSSSKDGNGKN